MSFTIGSLFDGSGGFPLAAALSGGVPLWASEVEPYPIAVTRSRFPRMKHLGDISRVNGAEIDPVDVITFGSPCQDMSVAGKRAGLKHEDNGDEETTRSGLFMEAVRIIKEMREKTNGRYPTFVLWENVPGAFSSNRGEDFRLVLEEIIKIAEPTAVMPCVPKGGWAYADCYRGDEWSIAYRVFNAKYWGVPQRRCRIYLVADFGSECADKILFEREGVCWDNPQSREAWQGTSADAERSTLADDRAAAVCYGISAYSSEAMMSNNPNSGIYVADTARTLDLNGGNPACNQGGIAVVDRAVCYDARGNGDGETASTLTGDHENRITDYTNVVTYGFDPGATRDVGDLFIPETAKTLAPGTCPEHHDGVVIAFDRAAYNQGENARYDFEVTDSGVNSTIVAKGSSGVCYAIGNGQANNTELHDIPGALNCMHDEQAVCYGVDAWNGTERTQYIVRRLTPTECARLQGFPDRWGDIDRKDEMTAEEYGFWREVRMTFDRINGRKEKAYTDSQILKWYNSLHNDGAEYKMWGNGIALPCALYIMQGIAEEVL